jgi:hypothetical protein
MKHFLFTISLCAFLLLFGTHSSYAQDMMERMQAVSLHLQKLKQNANEIETQVHLMIDWKRRDIAISEAYQQEQNYKLIEASCLQAEQMIHQMDSLLAFCSMASESLKTTEKMFYNAALEYRYGAEEWAQAASAYNRKTYQKAGLSARRRAQSGKQRIMLAEKAFHGCVDIVRLNCL